MDSFTLTAINNVARDPERGTHGECSSTRSCLLGNHAAGRDAPGKPLETVTRAWFEVLGKPGEILVPDARTGHQLVVPPHVRNNTWDGREGKRPYQLSFVTQQLRLRAPGRATRQQLAARPGRPLAVPLFTTHTEKDGPMSFAKILPLCIAPCCLLPGLALAQASPFMTGATALQTNILAWLTPVAVILVMLLGAMAMANRLSWGWCLTAILGISIAFGAPQIVTWVRGMFGV